MFAWLWDDVEFNKKHESNIDDLIVVEFDLYLHHQRERNSQSNKSWLWSIFYSLTQQNIRQDIEWTLYTYLRSDYNAQLVSYFYYVKYVLFGDSIFSAAYWHECLQISGRWAWEQHHSAWNRSRIDCSGQIRILWNRALCLKWPRVFKRVCSLTFAQHLENLAMRTLLSHNFTHPSKRAGENRSSLKRRESTSKIDLTVFNTSHQVSIDSASHSDCIIDWILEWVSTAFSETDHCTTDFTKLRNTAHINATTEINWGVKGHEG